MIMFPLLCAFAILTAGCALAGRSADNPTSSLNRWLDRTPLRIPEGDRP